MLWFLQHYLWDSRAAPDIDRRSTTPGTTATCASTAVRGRGGCRARRQARGGGLLPRLPPLPRARLRARRAARRAAGALRPHPVAAVRLDVLPEAMRRAVHEGLLANDVVGFHTDALGASTSQRELRGTSRRRYLAARTHVTHHADLDRPRRVRGAGAERPACSPRRSRSSSAAREARPARRPHRPVEEHRARLSTRSGCCSTPPEWRGRVQLLALLDPSRQDDSRVRRVPRCDRARGASA